MSVFNSFPDLPGPEDTAFCVLNKAYCIGNVHYGDMKVFSKYTKDHPKINVIKDVQHHRLSNENISIYVNVEDNLLKKITSVWYEQGILEALNMAADPAINRESKFLAVSASYVLKLANMFTTLRYFMQPHLKDIGPKIISKYSRTRNWNNAAVKCLAWHPHATKIALTTADDSVRIYCSEVPYISTLKCKAQTLVSSLCWRPYCASELAVGCEQGIVLWTIDPNSMFTKPSLSNAGLLKRSGHSPVTDVCWSPNGDLLVSCCGADPSMLIWDIAKETAIPLRRVAGGGIVFCRWSPDTSKIFAATTSIIFRIWDTPTWSPERWCARGMRVVAACWGPDESLLFAAKDEPIVYSLSNTGFTCGAKVTKAHPVLDLSKVELISGDCVGGPVLDMCWDPTGQYLAILFEETPIIAVFCTIPWLIQINITPCCLVKGLENELPSTIAFQQNFSDGACLTIAWCSGRIQYFPIINTN